MNFLNQLASGVYLILIPLFYSKAERYYIDSQFSHSSGIYFKLISKVRLFSEKYHFISYIDIFQPDVLKYKIIDFSHKLYEYCILSNIANNCNLYDHQTQLYFIEQRINYFLEEISFISRQARNIKNISKTNDPFLQQVQNVLLELRMRQETSLHWPKENLFLLPKTSFFTNLSSNLGNITTCKDSHNSQKDPNIHLYRILAANRLKDLHEISQSFLFLFDQLTEDISHAATNLWYPMLLPDTFLDFKSNKEDPYLLTSLFSTVLPFAKI